MGLERTRRQVDDQPLGLAQPAALELVGHDLDVPVGRELRRRIQFHEAALREGIKILSQNYVVLL
jgi:hypothetical protein